ncbi:class I SAM-dependent methyltransferase [Thermoplasmatales archaeon AK]|nr:class I SAM-dependent methyltransferase [Thermoplasmatales archaeon AK]
MVGEEQYLKLELDKEIPLAFVASGDHIFLFSTSPDARWPSSILRSGKCFAQVNGNYSEFRTSLVTSKTRKTELLAEFSKKYGADRVERWFDTASRCIELIPIANDTVENHDNYHAWLEAEFDSIAEDYDRHIFGNLINSYLRERSVNVMSKIFSKSHRLLELGCGSGTETIEMLKQGHEVVALDISQKMLDIVKAKAAKEGMAERIETVKLRVKDIGVLVSRYGEESFDGIYSTYGALNCEPDLSGIPLVLRRLLKNDGDLFLGVFNKICAFETIGYLLRIKPKLAIARFGKVLREGDSRFCVDSFPYTPWYYRGLFEPYFRVEKIMGVPVILPPSNLVRYIQPFSRGVERLKRIDNALGELWPFNLVGDHFLMILKPANNHRSLK